MVLCLTAVGLKLLLKNFNWEHQDAECPRSSRDNMVDRDNGQAQVIPQASTAPPTTSAG